MNEEAQTTREAPEIQVVKESLSDHLKIGPARPIGTSNKMICWAAKTFPQVKSAHDAYSPIRIRVMAKDTPSAKQKSPSSCAFARAACRELDADGAYIGIVESCIIVGEKVIRFQTPESVRREIVSFDRHRDFRPGEYQLSAVCPKRRLGARKTKTPNGSRVRLNRNRKPKTVPDVFHRTVAIRRSIKMGDLK
jgi:hypothetical protein